MPDLSSWVAAYGLWGLTLEAFLAATLLPLSSEVAVVAALQLGLPPVQVLLWASVGNCLGAITNYWLGLLCTKPVLARVQRERWGRQAWAWAERYGGWSLATSCLPYYRRSNHAFRWRPAFPPQLHYPAWPWHAGGALWADYWP